jgi:hypothetical protein
MCWPAFWCAAEAAGFMTGLAIAGFGTCALAAPQAFVTSGGTDVDRRRHAGRTCQRPRRVGSLCRHSIRDAARRLGGHVALGIVSQAGGIGTLAGPPLAALDPASQGWEGFGWLHRGHRRLRHRMPGTACRGRVLSNGVRRA